MNTFLDRLRGHIAHVKNVGEHCSTEETTKQALILPLLDILGFSPYDPTRVRAEYAADFPGAKSGERVDYALFCQGVPVMFVEAKAFGEKLVNHHPQLSRYFNATPEVTIAAVTNGREWRFFTDLQNKNVMDGDPFLTVDFLEEDVADLSSLYRFRHDEFRPEALRTLAEESVYLAAFKEVVSQSLRQCDAEFVRYVAGRSSVQRQLNQRFIDQITPLVRQAVERAVSEMVVSGLSSRPAMAEPPAQVDAVAVPDDPTADIVHPDNDRIVTTYAERRLFEVVKDILGDESDVSAKDTESYFTVLCQGKTTRWLLRYWGDKKRPSIQLCIELTPERLKEISRAGLEVSGNQIIIEKPEQLLRISGLVGDAYIYGMNDANFVRQRSVSEG